MPGKRIRQWVVVSVTLGLTGCCHWCERHCAPPPAATCCQPQMAYPQPVYQAQPAAYASPGCCPAPAAYPGPVSYQQPSYSQWQRPVAANGCCE
jgi:hypothetical protein